MAFGYMQISPPIDPHLRRWMLFVDGENLTIQAQKWVTAKGFSLTEGEHYLPNVFVWMPGIKASAALTNKENSSHLQVQPHAVRAYYYTSLVGNDQTVLEVRRALWKLGFHAEVFKNQKGRPAKGVDLALAKDFLSNAFNHNYDVAVLFAGDADYVPLIEEVKRLGKVVYVAFFCDEGFGLSERLMLSSDHTFDLGGFFQKQWAAAT